MPSLSRAARYVKLATAYSIAGRPRRSLRTLAIAKRHAAPDSNLAHFIKLETAANLLDIDSAAETERCLLSVMHIILEMTDPITLSSAVLYAGCCKFLCKMSVQLENNGAARRWLRRAMEAEDSLQLDGALVNSLQHDAQILSSEGSSSWQGIPSSPQRTSCHAPRRMNA